MSAFLLRRTDQGGGWVAPAGSAKSYTKSRDRARRYSTRDAAEDDRCTDNETVEEA